MKSRRFNRSNCIRSLPARAASQDIRIGGDRAGGNGTILHPRESRFRFQGKNRSSARHRSRNSSRRSSIGVDDPRATDDEEAISMSKEADNKAVVGRWFTEFWGKKVNLAVIDEIAAPDMLLKYSLHEPPPARPAIQAFMPAFPPPFP